MPTNESIIVSVERGWAIAVEESATPAERYAVEEFQRIFEQATGQQIPVADNPTHPIEIQADETLGEEDFRIQVTADGISIRGGRPRGTLYGVYQLLEDQLGVRFLTFDHVHVPQNPEPQIACGEVSCHPPLSFRWSYYRENTAHPEHAARLRVNTVTEDEKLGGKTGQSLINHSFHWLVPFNEYGKEHPEYYALFEGKRDTETGGGGPQLCVTNPEVIQIAAESVLRHLESHPNAQNVSVSQADTARYCHCDRCEEVNQREGTPMGSQLQFVNAVAEIVEKRYPDVKIGTLAYWYTRQAPKTIRPRPNV